MRPVPQGYEARFWFLHPAMPEAPSWSRRGHPAMSDRPDHRCDRRPYAFRSYTARIIPSGQTDKRPTRPVPQGYGTFWPLQRAMLEARSWSRRKYLVTSARPGIRRNEGGSSGIATLYRKNADANMEIQPMHLPSRPSQVMVPEGESTSDSQTSILNAPVIGKCRPRKD